MTKKTLFIGSGGHFLSMMDSLKECDETYEFGIVDNRLKPGQSVYGVPVIGSDHDLESLFLKQYHYAIIAFGEHKLLERKIELFGLLKKIGFQLPAVIDPTAIIGGDVDIQEGTFIGKGSIINSGSTVQRGSIINSGAIIEHECIIGAFSQIAPGAVLGGGVVIGDEVFIGMNASVRNGVSIGERAIIGMGSVVTKNINSDVVAYGNPCKEVRQK